MDEEINNQSVIFKINDTILDIFWADNESVSSLKTLAKDTLSINMHRYGDFEQVGSLNINLPANDEIITTSPGDICLYQSNQLVIFYGSNTYNYTKLGHINMSKLELRDLLSEEDVNITISLKSE